MTGDEDFRPAPGRSRDRRGPGYLKTLLRVIAISRAGAKATSRCLERKPDDAYRRPGPEQSPEPRAGASRQAVVKIRQGPAGGSNTGRHLHYLQRDAVALDGSPGRLYDATADQVEDREFLQRCRHDRQQYRIMLAAEDAAELGDLKPLTRALMARLEHDLGAELDWVAADHFDTGHPHSHILLRGCDRKGEPLEIPRGYLQHGLRRRAAEIVSAMLGPDELCHLKARLQADLHHPGLTFLDEALVARSEQGLLQPMPRPGDDSARERLRLRQLQHMGLAQMRPTGAWQIRPDMMAVLKQLSLQRRRIALLCGIASSQGRLLVPGRCKVMAFGQGQSRGLTGSLLAAGRDPGQHKAYLILDAGDGDLTYIHGVPEGAAAGLRPGSIVTLASQGLQIVSCWPLQRLIHHPGRTWLDDLLQDAGAVMASPPSGAEAAGVPQPASGFRLQLRLALMQRREFLQRLGLLRSDRPDAIPPDLAARLDALSLARLAAALNRKPLALPVHRAAIMRARLLGIVDTPKGPLAMLGNQSQLALAPLHQVELLGRGLAQAIIPNQ